ncbi:MAG: amidohydrolase family protein, partial [Pseudomonadales bacterium]|nr:amidohydrolase family protein [Pseudomonadales bacterium]
MELQDQATDSEHELLKAGLENGRFYDVDQKLKALLGRQLPPVKLASEKLACYGITGFSDMTPSNDQESLALFDQLKRDGLILQKVQLARRTPFSTADYNGVTAGPVKIHLHENRLPPLQDLVDRIVHCHKTDVAVAIHCVTDVELLFSLAALEEAGTVPGDRIEHASITPEYTLERIKALGVRVVTQPHFIAEKGDTYLEAIPVEEHESLYRCASFIEFGIPLAGSSDAPFGSADPWAAMKAAVERRTVSGQLIGSKEQLNPEQALGLFIGSLENPGRAQQIRPGMEANLCLLKYPWVRCRRRLSSADVKVVICEGANLFATEAVAEHVKNKNEHQTPCQDLAASA